MTDKSTIICTSSILTGASDGPIFERAMRNVISCERPNPMWRKHANDPELSILFHCRSIHLPWWWKWRHYERAVSYALFVTRNSEENTCRPTLTQYIIDSHRCAKGRAIKHPVPDGVKPSCVIFNIRALWRSALNVRVPGCQKLQMTA